MKITYIYLPSPYLKFCILIDSSSIANFKTAFFNHIKAFKQSRDLHRLEHQEICYEIFNPLQCYIFYTYLYTHFIYNM